MNTRHVLPTVAALCALSAATVASGQCSSSTVPPNDEIEVIEPSAPTSATIDEPTTNWREAPEPLVLVHRYYYSGDRSFQFKLLPGGRTVAVVHHPWSGRRCCIHLNLPPGAPRVRYSQSAIAYEYGRQTVSIRFPKCGPPCVDYCNGRSLHARAEDWSRSTRDCASRVVHSSGAPGFVDSTCRNLGGAAMSLERSASNMFGRILSPLRSSALGDMLTTSQSEAAEMQHERELRLRERLEDEGEFRRLMP